LEVDRDKLQIIEPYFADVKRLCFVKRGSLHAADGTNTSRRIACRKLELFGERRRDDRRFRPGIEQKIARRLDVDRDGRQKEITLPSNRDGDVRQIPRNSPFRLLLGLQLDEINRLIAEAWLFSRDCVARWFTRMI